MTEREHILSRLPQSQAIAPPEPFVLNPQISGSLWKQFTIRLTALGGRVAAWHDLTSLAGRKWCVDFVLDALPSECGSYEVADPWTADVGFTRGNLAVAETGTVLLQHGVSDRRLASLAPPIHVAVVRKSDIVASLDEAFLRLQPGNAVLVTGPSRTADIEGELVRGVHGPKEIWVVIAED